MWTERNGKYKLDRNNEWGIRWDGMNNYKDDEIQEYEQTKWDG